MRYTEYQPTEPSQQWQPPQSLKIIPYQKIETFPISYKRIEKIFTN